MIEQYKVNGFSFDNKEAYDCAVKEEQVVRTMRSKFKSSDTKMAYKVYVKAVQEHVFTTVVGYEFLMELRQAILASGSISDKKLPAIPVQGSSGGNAQAPVGNTGTRANSPGRYKRLYEGQRVINKRLKVILFAVFVVVAAFVIIDLNSEYSIFTYFTDYKSKMEQELIEKYRGWEKELEMREDALNQN